MNDDISRLGMGVLIGLLMGNGETAKVLKASIGKTITKLWMDSNIGHANVLHFAFEDGSAIKVADDGQSCCEHRYMTTDDDLQYYVGAKLTGMRLADGPSSQESWSYHDIQFLIVSTDKGDFTVETHNEHNGYYGGFLVCAAYEVLP